MSQLSDYLEQNLLNHILNEVSFSVPTSTHVALFTVTPSDSGGGTEVTGGAYARKYVAPNASAATTKWNSAASDPPGFVVDNAAEIAFPQATANWGNVVAFGIFTHPTTGNLLYWGPLAATKTVNANDTFKFAAGDLNLRLE